MSNIWFAEKQDGTLLELTEIEALTHFEKNNNIAQRMMLRFIGTSDGSEYEKARLEVKRLMEEKRSELYPKYQMMNVEEKRFADYETQAKIKDDIKNIMEEGRKAELELAKKNGVMRPDPNLRIITKATGVNASRNQILKEMGKM